MALPVAHLAVILSHKRTPRKSLFPKDRSNRDKIHCLHRVRSKAASKNTTVFQEYNESIRSRNRSAKSESKNSQKSKRNVSPTRRNDPSYLLALTLYPYSSDYLYDSIRWPANFVS
jgi:hypothetical protein